MIRGVVVKGYYHALPIPKEAKEGCNLVVRLMKEALLNAV